MIFLFFGTSLALLEAELELFEVWEIWRSPKLQTVLTRVLDELERNQKKGKSSKFNFQNDGHLSSGPAVHV